MLDRSEAARAELERMVQKLKEGERLRIEPYLIDEAFPRHPLFRSRPSIDQFLESRIGSNYGAWRCEFDANRGFYEISRHPVGDKIIRRDYDRRHIPLRA